MNGYMLAIGPCWGCGAMFAFNPDRVPSIVVEGERQALCRACVARANRLRASTGAPPIVPLAGAYEPEGEGE
jgi:hypothetical protein